MRLKTKIQKFLNVYTHSCKETKVANVAFVYSLFFSAPHPKCYSLLVLFKYVNHYGMVWWLTALYMHTLLNDMNSCSVFCTQFNIKVISVGQTLHTQKKNFFFRCILYIMISWLILIVGNLHQFTFEYE